MKRSFFAAVVAPVLVVLAAGAAALAQPPETAKPEATERPPFDLSYVPGDAMFVDREMLERMIARADGKPVDWRGGAAR